VVEESLGQYLQQGRTAKGYSLKDVSVITCIGLAYLKALEADDFSKLPPQTITKSYVRTYAHAVGLDEARVIKLFTESAGVYYREQEAAKNARPLKNENPLKSRLEEVLASFKMLF
jgi:cytoskeletal protein RodZ